MSELNDPRVFFAAERTLLAWNRTSLTLLGFGFVVERFGLFLHMLAPPKTEVLPRGISFWIGMGFIALGIVVAVFSVIQYRTVLSTLREVEIPPGYWTVGGVITNLSLALLGLLTMIYLSGGFN